MPKYIVWVQENNYGYHLVEADNEEQVREMYYNGEFPDNFRHKNGDNVIERIEKLDDKEKI